MRANLGYRLADDAAAGTVPEILIGTSGFSYRHWRDGVFYPKTLPYREELSFMARTFRTVELNSPFYRLPSKENFEHWASLTPPDFVFAVKASRFITHIQRLLKCQDSVATLLERAAGLGDKLGPILFQLPPTFRLDVTRLVDFLELLPPAYQYTFEFRNEEWFNSAVYDLLVEYQCALCLPVAPGLTEPPEVATAPFTYVRMHSGAGEWGDFAESELREWARKVRQLGRSVAKVYVYFNNDAMGCAVRNAIRLRELLGVER